jgi:hypothetical protein
MTIDLLRRLQSWTEGALSTPGTQLAVAEFATTPLWFPGARQVSAGGAVQRLHLFPGDAGELPTLGVWLHDPATLSPPVTAPTLQATGGALLSFVMNQRFNVVLDDHGERCLLTYDDLLGLRSLMLAGRVADGVEVDAGEPPDVSRLVAPLVAHCAGEPSIRRAWLAVVQSPAGAQATVLLDTPQPDLHRAALTTLLDPLLPPGVSMTVLDAQDRHSAHLREAIARFDPLHDAAARPGWMDRMKQRFSPPVVPVIPLDLHG